MIDDVVLNDMSKEDLLIYISYLQDAVEELSTYVDELEALLSWKDRTIAVIKRRNELQEMANAQQQDAGNSLKIVNEFARKMGMNFTKKFYESEGCTVTFNDEKKEGSK